MWPFQTPTSIQLTAVLEVERVSYGGCDFPVENFQRTLKTVAYVFCILGEITILIRIFVNSMLAQNFRTGDWVIVLVGVSLP